ncbi:hypothetical protein SCP_0600240 [Sparassis crispa]|uniref:Uncharacterized protein n=1 Tax=Sparassis crispa TaxID=139825 RepID=A0A401GPA1_9APHY|nr:hypothetical protein SCP_0600240 [Sparassis crispa]GBE84047.1 hypothetical protein SCP_0600240 [Sparassis crispa]
MRKTGLCLALFVLIEPVESGQHTSSTTEKFTNELIEDMASEDIDVFTSQLRETMQDLAEAAGRRLEEDRSVSICHPVLSEGRQREDSPRPRSPVLHSLPHLATVRERLLLFPPPHPFGFR